MRWRSRCLFNTDFNKRKTTMSDKNKEAALAADTKTGPAAEQRAEVKALLPKVKVPGWTLAKGGRAVIDLKTAEYKAKNGEVEIVRVL